MRITKEKAKKEFIKKAIIIHNNKYDYSKINYVKARISIEIICPIHGSFWQSPDNHNNKKQDCPYCMNVKQFTTEEFIKKANLVHGNKYDYSKVNYVKGKQNIIIICSIHGEFLQRPDVHTNLKGGCPDCAIDYRAKKKKLDAKNLFIKKAMNVHGNKYDYSKFIYIKAIIEGTIICPKHGEFNRSPRDHYSKGYGCPECSREQNESKDCIYITNWLNRNGINYKKEKRFITCKDRNPLSFDFYLLDKNILIEYNGRQHDEFIVFYHKTIENFYKQQKRDKIKIEWAKDNSIKLIIIKYNEFKNNTELENLLYKRIIYC